MGAAEGRGGLTSLAMRVLRTPLARVVLFLMLTAAAFPLGGIAVGTLGTASGEVRVTQLYAEFTYTAPAGGGGSKNVPLSGVGLAQWWKPVQYAQRRGLW